MPEKVRVRKTPNCLHPYTATMKGKGTYGWGSTPDEARKCLKRNLARADAAHEATVEAATDAARKAFVAGATVDKETSDAVRHEAEAGPDDPTAR